MRFLRKQALQIALHVACLVPFALLLWDYTQDALTVNPIQEITSRTGKTAIILLVLTLACTPVSTLFGIKRVIAFRRPLGLYAFFYASLHFLTFVVLDYGLRWDLIQQAVVEKRFVLAGFSAFLLLTPLAITSTKGWMRRMGRRWKVLHRCIYVAALLAVLHYLWLVKSDIREPLVYAAIVVLLLALRLPAIRKAISRVRSRINAPRHRDAIESSADHSPSA